MKKLLTKILWKGQQKWQFAFAGAGFVIGLAMVLVALQIFTDIQSIFTEKKGEGQFEYLIVTKNVSAFNSLSFISEKFESRFSESELKDLQDQPFILDQTPIVPNEFEVISNLSEKLDFYADLFFESVPNEFLDTIPDGWDWKPGDGTVQILLAKEWLDLYNFNVSIMYGLPQLSAESLKGMDFKLAIKKGSKIETYNAKIAGLSYRMPSLTLPYSFMIYGNENFGTKVQAPAKVMIKVNDAGDPQLAKYLLENNYDSDQERLVQDSFRRIAQVIYSISAVIGLLFTLLSVVIFIITLQLRVAQAQEKIKLLLALGYKPSVLQQNLLLNFLKVLLIFTIVAFVIYVAATYFLQGFLIKSGFELSRNVSWIVIIAGVSLATLSVGINFLFVRSGIRKYY